MTTKTPQWTKLVRTPLRVREQKRLRECGGQVRSPADVARFLGERAVAEDVEVFYVLALNSQHVITAVTELTRGILNASLVAPREVFRWALAMNAADIVLAHNHPSGDTTPSQDDRNVTKSLVEAGRIVEIPVLDHVILGSPGFYSFAEAGLL